VTIENWSCPMPLRDHPTIVMGHGGGGQLSAELIQHLFVPAFGDGELSELADAAVIDAGGLVAFSTDTFVVRPRFFPGGNIGELAVNGTVNDVAMRGAVPRFLSVGLILEEGLPMAELGVIVESIAAAAAHAGVTVVTGDTKVVDRGHGDGVYVNTTGIGTLREGADIRPQRAEPGDAVIVSGTVGDHGMAIMSVREGLEFETSIISDTAALNHMIADVLDTGADVHVLRDPTRGGLAASLNEIANAADVGVLLDERSIPVDRTVAAACEMLGMDPMYVANEGKVVAFVRATDVDRVLDAMRAHPEGTNATVVGEVTDTHRRMVAARTPLGATRVVDMQVGEQLPRIC
jgi:hydrogenase expression/formation protein HypE